VALTLPAPGDKAAVVRAMFDRIAPRYDRLNRLLTFGLDRGWRRAAVAASGAGPGRLVVDVACGTGDLAALAARAGARVLAIDFAPAMLRLARGRGAVLARADALALPVRDGAADAVTCGFALRNVTAIPDLLAEARRVLRCGGRLVLLEVAEPRGTLRRWGHRAYFHHVVPLVGGLLADREAYAYLPASTAYLPGPVRLHAQLEAGGFTSIRRRLLAGGGVQLVTAERGGAPRTGGVT
jgi:demethylmenaquinone methyltransferase/2-methoxy-6-polyprenyl-1,4-benzoquinol methylase